MGTPDPDGAARERERPGAEDGELPDDARRRRVDLGDGVASGRDDPDGGRHGKDASGPELAGREEHRLRYAAGCGVDPGDGESSWFCTHTDPWPMVTPFGSPPTRVSLVTAFVSGSIRSSLSPKTSIAHTAPKPAARPITAPPSSMRATTVPVSRSSRATPPRPSETQTSPAAVVRLEGEPPTSVVEASRSVGSPVGDATAAGATSAAETSSSRIDLFIAGTPSLRGVANRATVRRRAEMPLKERQTASK